MRIIAPMMILIMMTSTLAGCTGGDPDSGGEMDTDAINDLIDQNLQDFINNTTITVNQEIHHHYYNNTTVNEGDLTNNDYITEYNNTTTIMNDITDNSISNINGSSSISSLKMFTVEWDPSEYVEYYDIGNETISLDGNLQQSNNNPTLLLMYIYNGYTVEFKDITCNQMFNFGSNWIEDNDWEDYLETNFGWDEQIYSVANNIRNDFYELKNYNDSVKEQCGYFSTYYYDDVYVNIYSIELGIGEAFELVSTGHINNIELECDDGFSTNLHNNSGVYFGGQANCTVTAIAAISVNSGSWNTFYVHDNHDNDSGATVPDWYDGNYWGGFDSSISSSFSTATPENFAVYFNILNVDVYL